MAFNYPKTIRFGDAVAKVRFAKVIDRDKDCLGLYDPVERTIWIKKGMDPDKTLKTFIHECLHFIDEEASIGITHKTIHRLELPLYMFIRDNSELFRRSYAKR